MRKIPAVPGPSGSPTPHSHCAQSLRLRPIIARGMPQAPLKVPPCVQSPQFHLPASHRVGCRLAPYTQNLSSKAISPHDHLRFIPDRDHERAGRPSPSHLWSSKCISIIYLVRQAPVSLEPETHPGHAGLGTCLQAVASLPEHGENTRHRSPKTGSCLTRYIHVSTDPIRTFQMVQMFPHALASLSSNCVICALIPAAENFVQRCVPGTSQPTLFHATERAVRMPYFPTMSHDFPCFLPRSSPLALQVTIAPCPTLYGN